MLATCLLFFPERDSSKFLLQVHCVRETKKSFIVKFLHCIMDRKEDSDTNIRLMLKLFGKFIQTFCVLDSAVRWSCGHGTGHFCLFPIRSPFVIFNTLLNTMWNLDPHTFFCAYIKLKIYRKRVMKLTEVVTDTEIQFLSSLPLFR